MLELIILLTEQVDVAENGDFLLRQDVDSIALGQQSGAVVLVLKFGRLAVVSNTSDLYLHLLGLLVCPVDFLLRVGVGVPLPLYLIFDQLALLCHDFVVAERVLEPPYFVLRVVEPASETVSLLVRAAPLLLHHVESPSQRMDFGGDGRYLVSELRVQLLDGGDAEVIIQRPRIVLGRPGATDRNMVVPRRGTRSRILPQRRRLSDVDGLLSVHINRGPIQTIEILHGLVGAVGLRSHRLK